MAKKRLNRPFRLCTTSFIYPDHIIPNVRKIGHLFDEIELLVFESQPEDVLPSAEDIKELEGLGRDLNLTYNVHLPVDISLAAESGRERQFAADTLRRVMDRVAPLNPTSHTLHLDMEKGISDGDRTKIWETRARKGLDLLVPHLSCPETLCAETLWYDPRMLESLVLDYNLSVCADLGHHFKYGYDINRTFEMFKGRILLIHLHGVDTGRTPPKDHTGLDRLPKDLFDRTMAILKAYTGTVSLEVFGLAQLLPSLQRLGSVFENIPEVLNVSGGPGEIQFGNGHGF